MGDLVDQDPQVLVEQLARDRLLDQVKLCRTRILIAADPAEKEPGEPRLSLVPSDRCLGGVISANHQNGIPPTRAVAARHRGGSAGGQPVPDQGTTSTARAES